VPQRTDEPVQEQLALATERFARSIRDAAGDTHAPEQFEANRIRLFLDLNLQQLKLHFIP
jgi:hypothetical protein